MIVTYWDVGGAEEVVSTMDREKKCRSRLLRGYETIRITVVGWYGVILGEAPESGEWLKVQLQASGGRLALDARRSSFAAGML